MGTRSDHPLARLVGEDSHARWVVAIVSIALVSLVGSLLALDRDHVSTMAREALVKAIAVEKDNAVLKARLDSQLSAIRDDVAEIKEILRERRKP